jgi:predicted nucleic acid-binding protein
MIAFVDASVILRKLFGERGPLQEWVRIKDAYACRLLPIEIARVIDRCRLAGDIDDADVSQLHQETRRILRSISVLTLGERILQRAAAPMPTVVGSLDAIHLATALELAPSLAAPLVFATHDGQLARAARASGLDAVGA